MRDESDDGFWELGCKEQVGAELARAFAEHGWKLPEGGESGYRMHGWLMRAAVVGGNHVQETIGAATEAAIGKLAEVTWERLWVVRRELGYTTECWEEDLAGLERERQAEREKAEGRQEKVEGREQREERPPTARERFWRAMLRLDRPPDLLRRLVRCWTLDEMDVLGC